MKYMDGISGKIEQLAVRKYVIPLVILLFLILSVMQVGPYSIEKLSEASGGIGMLDMKFGYSEILVNRMMENLGDAGRQLYMKLLCIDFLFVIVFMLLQVILISVLLPAAGTGSSRGMLMFLPLLRSAFDILENSLLLAILTRYTSHNAALIWAASLMTMLKWIVFCAIIVVIVVLCVMALRRYIASSKSNSQKH
ncbi:MAG: hypothetical protein JW817_04845 [Clostridiales bacterium]|nr:hypothetical protein [Clostridiales bacterium]